MEAAGAKGGQQTVRTHQVQDTCLRGAQVSEAQTGPPLAMAFAMEGGLFQDRSDVFKQGRIVARPRGTPSLRSKA